MVGSAHPTTVYLKEQTIGSYARQSVEALQRSLHRLATVAASGLLFQGKQITPALAVSGYNTGDDCCFCLRAFSGRKKNQNNSFRQVCLSFRLILTDSYLSSVPMWFNTVSYFILSFSKHGHTPGLSTAYHSAMTCSHSSQLRTRI